MTADRLRILEPISLTSPTSTAIGKTTPRAHNHLRSRIQTMLKEVVIACKTTRDNQIKSVSSRSVSDVKAVYSLPPEDIDMMLTDLDICNRLTTSLKLFVKK